MARRKGWTVIISLLLGMVGASLFWLYHPYLQDRLAPGPAPEVKGGPLGLGKPTSQALGSRFQMVADGKQVFLVDLAQGRVWRYFQQTREGGFSKEDEGFLPIGLYYGGKKHYAASEIEPPTGAAGSPAPSGTGEQPPQ